MKRNIFSTSLIALLPLTFAACGGSGGTGGGGGSGGTCTPTGGTNSAKWVTNAVMVPQQRTDFSIDLNGDGRADNQLGNIIGALQGQNLDVQMGVSDAVANGQLIILANETSSDATFSMDTCASTQLSLGALPTGTTTPKYDGTGMFTATMSAGDAFAGPITAGKFSSTQPAVQTTPVSVTIKLPLVPGATPVELHVIGAHLQFTKMGDMITGGQLHGAIKNDDVQNTIIPNVAGLLTMKLGDGTSTGMQIGNIFDTGGKADATCTDPNNASLHTCKNPDGSCASKGDKVISPCEVSTSGLIQNVLAPDVQMFQNGVYMPNKDNTTKDSLSLGIGFTMVKASY